MSKLGLTPKELVFVREYARCGVASDAARAAGYSEGYSRKAAAQLLRRPRVAEAVEENRQRLREEAAYTSEKAVAEIDRLIEEARAAKQYTAVSSLMQTKLKMFGMLIERVHQLHEQVDLRGAIEAARARVQSDTVFASEAPRIERATLPAISGKVT